jgi:type 1 glutamine amidotransferase
MKKILSLVLTLACALSTVSASAETKPVDYSILVFSKTAGFRHGSIGPGREALEKLGREHGFDVVTSERPEDFSPENLARFRVVVFLNTTGTIFSQEQRQAFEEFIRAGDGFVGIHSAADTEYEWEWYGRLVGAYFINHPQIQEARIVVEDRKHPATAHLDREWIRRDEWYNFRANPRERVNILLSLDTSSFEGSRMMEDHPIAWFHEFDGGRAFYTGLGHTNESFREEAFLQHLLGAIQWAAGKTAAKR